MKCPSCDHISDIPFETCPKCNIIISKYIEKAQERKEREERRLKRQEEERTKLIQEQEREQTIKREVTTDKTCPYCKMEIHKEAKICPYCRKRQKISNKTTIIVLGGVFILLIAMCNSKPYTPPKINQNWNESTNVDISRVLVSNNITGCSFLKWQQTGNYEYIVQCSKDNQNWTTYQVWTAINAVNLYGR